MSEPAAQETVTVHVFCYEDQPPYKVLWEPTGDEFVVNPGDAFTFTFRRSKHAREDWTDIEMGVGTGWVYLGGSNFKQHEVTRNGAVVWSYDS